jgi:hypothetical protein
MQIRNNTAMIVSSWLHPSLEKRCSLTRGCGIFARADIREGERLALFGGRIMRIDDRFKLPEEMQQYTMQIEERLILGPAGTDPEDTVFSTTAATRTADSTARSFLSRCGISAEARRSWLITP